MIPKYRFRNFISPEYRENFSIIELRDEREEYIVIIALVRRLTG